MKVTVLGCAAGGVPRAGDGGSGYLLEEGGTKLLVDCGNGILGELARHARLEEVSGIFLSHLHADHCQDVIPFALHRRFRGRGRLPLFGPPGTKTLLYRLFHLFHPANVDAYVEAFQVTEVKPWEVHELGDLRLQASPVEHNVSSFALRASPRAGGRLFVYSSDTKASALLVEAALNADLLLAEATFQDLEEGKAPEATRDHHMTAREAGETARKAGAKRLVLTHLQYFLGPAASKRQAEEAFGAPVEVARVGATYEI